MKNILLIITIVLGLNSCNENKHNKLKKIDDTSSKKLKKIAVDTNNTKIKLSLEPLTKVGEFYFKVQQKIDKKLKDIAED